MQAEQAAEQFDGDTRGAAALVEERIELDNVDRAHQFRIMQQFHDQMGLAVGGAAGNGGADARCDRRIEKIDVEADMQHAVLRFHLLDHPPDQDGNTNSSIARMSAMVTRRSWTRIFSSGSIDRMPNRSS